LLKIIISDSDLKVISDPDLNIEIISDTDPQQWGEENCEVREGREGVVKGIVQRILSGVDNMLK
jgi:hypothetical protein